MLGGLASRTAPVQPCDAAFAAPTADPLVRFRAARAAASRLQRAWRWHNARKLRPTGPALPHVAAVGPQREVIGSSRPPSASSSRSSSTSWRSALSSLTEERAPASAPLSANARCFLQSSSDPLTGVLEILSAPLVTAVTELQWGSRRLRRLAARASAAAAVPSDSAASRGVTSAPAPVGATAQPTSTLRAADAPSARANTSWDGHFGGRPQPPYTSWDGHFGGRPQPPAEQPTFTPTTTLPARAAETYLSASDLYAAAAASRSSLTAAVRLGLAARRDERRYAAFCNARAAEQASERRADAAASTSWDGHFGGRPQPPTSWDGRSGGRPQPPSSWDGRSGGRPQPPSSASQTRAKTLGTTSAENARRPGNDDDRNTTWDGRSGGRPQPPSSTQALAQTLGTTSAENARRPGSSDDQNTTWDGRSGGRPQPPLTSWDGHRGRPQPPLFPEAKPPPDDCKQQ